MFLNNRNAFAVLLIGSLLLAGQAARAVLADSPIQLVSQAEIEIIERDINGQQQVKREPASEVIPGKDIIYTLTFENFGTVPGNDIVINNPIPKDTVYKADTATGADTLVSFSVDGGHTFDSPERLMMKGADGSLRVANAAEYTTIRWQYLKPLLPGNKSTVEFRVVLQ
jgi:uncharacterized repeat protein (TIGR01451 family)